MPDDAPDPPLLALVLSRSEAMQLLKALTYARLHVESALKPWVPERAAAILAHCASLRRALLVAFDRAERALYLDDDRLN